MLARGMGALSWNEKLRLLHLTCLNELSTDASRRMLTCLGSTSAGMADLAAAMAKSPSSPTHLREVRSNRAGTRGADAGECPTPHQPPTPREDRTTPSSIVLSASTWQRFSPTRKRRTPRPCRATWWMLSSVTSCAATSRAALYVAIATPAGTTSSCPSRASSGAYARPAAHAACAMRPQTITDRTSPHAPRGVHG